MDPSPQGMARTIAVGWVALAFLVVSGIATSSCITATWEEVADLNTKVVLVSTAFCGDYARPEVIIYNGVQGARMDASGWTVLIDPFDRLAATALTGCNAASSPNVTTCRASILAANAAFVPGATEPTPMYYAFVSALMDIPNLNVSSAAYHKQFQVRPTSVVAKGSSGTLSEPGCNPFEMLGYNQTLNNVAIDLTQCVDIAEMVASDRVCVWAHSSDLRNTTIDRMTCIQSTLGVMISVNPFNINSVNTIVDIRGAYINLTDVRNPGVMHMFIYGGYASSGTNAERVTIIGENVKFASLASRLTASSINAPDLDTTKPFNLSIFGLTEPLRSASTGTRSTRTSKSFEAVVGSAAVIVVIAVIAMIAFCIAHCARHNSFSDTMEDPGGGSKKAV